MVKELALAIAVRIFLAIFLPQKKASNMFIFKLLTEIRQLLQKVFHALIRVRWIAGKHLSLQFRPFQKQQCLQT